VKIFGPAKSRELLIAGDFSLGAETGQAIASL
jgi:hypothetical protein